jgi:hypothetical protein
VLLLLFGLALLGPPQTDSRQDGSCQRANPRSDNAAAFDATERTTEQFIKSFAFHWG